MTSRLRFLLATAHQTLLDRALSSVRVPTESGQVGLRPRQEPLILAVEPGLVVMRTEDSVSFAATAGGLLEGDRQHVVLYTPFAVVGDGEAEVLAALDRALSRPNGELSLRRKLGELEQRIIRELGHPEGSTFGGPRGPT